MTLQELEKKYPLIVDVVIKHYVEVATKDEMIAARDNLKAELNKNILTEPHQQYLIDAYNQELILLNELIESK